MVWLNWMVAHAPNRKTAAWIKWASIALHGSRLSNAVQVDPRSTPLIGCDVFNVKPNYETIMIQTFSDFASNNNNYTTCLHNIPQVRAFTTLGSTLIRYRIHPKKSCFPAFLVIFSSGCQVDKPMASLVATSRIPLQYLWSLCCWLCYSRTLYWIVWIILGIKLLLLLQWRQYIASNRAVIPLQSADNLFQSDTSHRFLWG